MDIDLAVKRIKELAKNKGYKMKFICSSVNVRDNYFTDCRNKKIVIPDTIIEVLSKILETNENYLAGTSDDPSPTSNNTDNHTYDLQTIENRIMAIATQMGLSKNKLLINAKLGKSFFDNMKKSQIPSVEKLHIMADYLNVSIDYLVGRTDKPNLDTSPATTGASVTTDEPVTQEQKLNEDELELVEIYRSLSKRARHELMVMTYEMKDRDELEGDRENYVNYDVG